MLLEDLYKNVLIGPNSSGANELFAVSGYASATFANRHLNDLKSAKVNLIIGMPGKRSDHLGFINLYDRYKGRFDGYYLKDSPPVHSKVYSWFNDDKPVKGFAGSANYSQPGFFSKTQINQVSYEDPVLIKSFYDSLLPRCVNIRDFDFTGIQKQIHQIGHQLANSVFPGTIHWEIPNRRVRISLLDRTGQTSSKSALNWGQRLTREPNQAYLPLRKESRDEGFLPKLAETFTLITDDNYSMDCVVAQQGRKAIHSTDDNSEIGKYIRNRIGVPLGEYVKTQDLINYGRTDFTIEKLNEETYLLDLSV
jgi:hypothetical protein